MRRYGVVVYQVHIPAAVAGSKYDQTRYDWYVRSEDVRSLYIRHLGQLLAVAEGFYESAQELLEVPSAKTLQTSGR
jgi:hypothetical protein